MLGLLIAVGLVLSPIAAAMPAKAQTGSHAMASHAMAMPDCPSHAKAKPAATADHSCCDHNAALAACAAALCALKCFKVAAVLDGPAGGKTIAPHQRILPSLSDERAPLSWRPPTPPPRA